MIEKVLILPVTDYGFIPFNRKNNTYIELLFNAKKTNVIRKILHKVYLLRPDIFLNLPIYLEKIVFNIIFKNWFKIVKNVNTIIVFDSKKEDAQLFKLIHKIYPKKRLILWYWNNIDKENIFPSEIDRNYVELWSFDPKDCKKYNLQYNVQFYPLENTLKELCTNDKFDLLYIGASKSYKRLELLEKIDQKCKKEKINNNFYIVQQASKKIQSNIPYRPFLRYPQVLKFISQTKCILDITKENQSGLTLRPLEALFFDKKLITNNKEIIKHKIYQLNSKNIYILGVNKGNLKDFIESSYDNKNDSFLKKYYSFDRWLYNFFK